MDKEMLGTLSQMHNILCDITVSGENAIKITSCILTLRKLLGDVGHTETEASASIEGGG